MALMRPMTRREKIILLLTIVVAFATVLYLAGDTLLATFQSSSEELERARAKIRQQELLLSKAKTVKTEYNKVAARLPKIDPDRGPEAVLSELIAKICRELKIARPGISAPRVQAMEAEDFAFLILPLSNIKGPPATITSVLAAFYDHQLIVLNLRLDLSGSGSVSSLVMSGDVAQIIKKDDLSKEYLEALEKD